MTRPRSIVAIHRLPTSCESSLRALAAHRNLSVVELGGTSPRVVGFGLGLIVLGLDAGDGLHARDGQSVPRLGPDVLDAEGPKAPLVAVGHRIDVDFTVALMRSGVVDVIALPAAPEQVATRALSHVDVHVDGDVALGSADPGAAHGRHPTPARRTLVGDSAPMQRVRRDIALAASARSNVLLTGETGTGKGLIARMIHDASPHAREPFVHLDCAALSATVIESELFGHERGAFTGAVARRQGRFELAARGTLFLDEVGELPAPLQAKLLRVLQDRSFERVGGVETLPMTARIVAATNRELRQEVREERFRRDLYFRLKVLAVEVPPLREHPEDLPRLLDHGFRTLAAQLQREPPRIDPSVLAALSRYPWPGNVRELMNLVERLLVSWPGRSLEAPMLAGLLEDEDLASGSPYASHSPRLQPGPLRPAQGTLPGVGDRPDEARQIAAVLQQTGGNIARAARRLGVSRSTLRYRIKRHGLRGMIPGD